MLGHRHGIQLIQQVMQMQLEMGLYARGGMGNQKWRTRTSVFPVQSMLTQDLSRFGLIQLNDTEAEPIDLLDLIRSNTEMRTELAMIGLLRLRELRMVPRCHESTIAKPSSKKWRPSKLWAVSFSHTMEEDPVAVWIIYMLTLNPLRQVGCCLLLLIIILFHIISPFLPTSDHDWHWSIFANDKYS